MKGKRDQAIAAGEFKAKCLAVLDQVALHGSSFVVTKRGRPVARVIPLQPASGTSLLGTLVHEDDLLSPVDAPWESG